MFKTFQDGEETHTGVGFHEGLSFTQEHELIINSHSKHTYGLFA